MQEPHASSPPATVPSPQADVIDLSYLISILLKWFWVPVLTAASGLYFGYQDLRSFSPEYVATMIVLPSGGPTAGAQSGGAVQSIVSELGLLRGSQATAMRPFDRLTFFLGSVALADRLQQEYGMLQMLYGDSWDAESREWIRPSGEDFERDQRRRAFFRQNLWSPPNLQTLADFVKGSIQIEGVGEGGGQMQRLTVRSQDPEFALWLLDTVYFAADDLIREMDRAEVLQRMAYVEQQLATVDKVHIRDGLREQLASELGRQVALEVDLPYTATVIEAARVGNSRTEPNVRLLFGIPVVVGGVIGFSLVALVALFRRERRSV